MNITLRIKRKYFDLILSREKKVEYRAVKEYYERLFSNSSEIKTLTLHYQGDRKLKAAVISISKIPTPEWIRKESSLDIGRETFAIVLKNPRLIK